MILPAYSLSAGIDSVLVTMHVPRFVSIGSPGWGGAGSSTLFAGVGTQREAFLSESVTARSIHVREGVLHGLVECHRLALSEVRRLLELPENLLVPVPLGPEQTRARCFLNRPNAAPKARGYVSPAPLGANRCETGERVSSLKIVTQVTPYLEALAVEACGLDDIAVVEGDVTEAVEPCC